MAFDTKTNYYILVAILVAILVVFFMYFRMENFQDEDTSILDKTEILDQCKEMTAEKLFKLFNEDLDYLTQVFVDNNIPLSAIKDISYYPKIASLLVNRGILKC